MQRKAGLLGFFLLILSPSLFAAQSEGVLTEATPEKRLSEARVLLQNAEIDDAEAKESLERIQAQKPVDTGNPTPALGAQQEMYDLAEGARRQAVQDAEHNLQESQKVWDKARAEYEKSHPKKDASQ